jgi:hypothetical protein
MRNFGMEDKEVGSSSIWLLKRFKISKLIRFARPGGTTEKQTVDSIIIIIIICNKDYI